MATFTVSMWVEFEAEDIHDAYEKAEVIASKINANLLDVEEMDYNDE